MRISRQSDADAALSANRQFPFSFVPTRFILQFLCLLLSTGDVDYGKLLGEMMGSGLVSTCPIEGATAQNLALAGLCTQNTPVLGAVASC